MTDHFTTRLCLIAMSVGGLLLTLAAGLLLIGTVNAQGIADPTRPPDASTAVVGPAGAVPGNPTQLHSVIVPLKGKPFALIGDQQVTVGSKVGDARVIRITESTVVLRSAEGEQILRMTPDAEKQPVVAVKSTGVKKSTADSKIKNSTAGSKAKSEPAGIIKEKSTP